ncbi:MAG: type II secretion system GspH family protein [Elusimicrobium sp.]|jgi:prepilin-type N-terminal cleavage/methylation domain-containing protein|nr:type II secretion system GspH family protein [Elusimicrobium sp.]
MLRQNAFTLIELLVVVLIIGILAAIAVPQYQKSVERSRASEAFILGRAAFDAAKRYELESGSWPVSFDGLDVGFSYESAETPSGWSQMLYLLDGKFALYLGNTQILVDRIGDRRYTIVFYRANNSIWCGAEGVTGSTTADSQICISLGGVLGTPPAGCSRNKCYRLR